MACILLAWVLRTAGGSEPALSLLDEARQRFEAVAQARINKAAERMASVCFAEQGDCLLLLGRLDEAAAVYEETIRRAGQLDDDRQVAVGKIQLGTVRMQQHNYTEALATYTEARDIFTGLGEPGTVAGIWHQTGTAYQNAGQPDRAEDAYRRSLAIEVRLGNVAGQARTLEALGILYGNALGQTEEAVAFLRQSVVKWVEIRDVASEGRNRSNLAIRLHKLRRFDEARQEIRRSIECKAQFGHAAEPWKSWDILAAIETDAGNPAAAGEARGKAIASYLAYRRDGGENHNTEGRIALAVTQSLHAGDPASVVALLQQLAADPGAAWLIPFIRALQAIVAGSRGPGIGLRDGRGNPLSDRDAGQGGADGCEPSGKRPGQLPYAPNRVASSRKVGSEEVRLFRKSRTSGSLRKTRRPVRLVSIRLEDSATQPALSDPGLYRRQ